MLTIGVTTNFSKALEREARAQLGDMLRNINAGRAHSMPQFTPLSHGPSRELRPVPSALPPLPQWRSEGRNGGERNGTKGSGSSEEWRRQMEMAEEMKSRRWSEFITKRAKAREALGRRAGRGGGRGGGGGTWGDDMPTPPPKTAFSLYVQTVRSGTDITDDGGGSGGGGGGGGGDNSLHVHRSGGSGSTHWGAHWGGAAGRGGGVAPAGGGGAHPGGGGALARRRGSTGSTAGGGAGGGAAEGSRRDSSVSMPSIASAMSASTQHHPAAAAAGAGRVQSKGGGGGVKVGSDGKRS